nr:MAG TPA: hypothetical protein [Caudoviricetes sp.]
MNDIFNQDLYHVIAYSAKNVDDEEILYIFTDRESAVNKAVELHKIDKEAFELLKRKSERYTQKLCDKYEITAASPYDIEEEVYDLATEEEIDKFDSLYYSILDNPYIHRSYTVRGYKVDENGRVVKIYIDGGILFTGGIQDE